MTKKNNLNNENDTEKKIEIENKKEIVTEDFLSDIFNLERNKKIDINLDSIYSFFSSLLYAHKIIVIFVIVKILTVLEKILMNRKIIINKLKQLLVFFIWLIVIINFLFLTHKNIDITFISNYILNIFWNNIYDWFLLNIWYVFWFISSLFVIYWLVKWRKFLMESKVKYNKKNRRYLKYSNFEDLSYIYIFWFVLFILILFYWIQYWINWIWFVLSNFFTNFFNIWIVILYFLIVLSLFINVIQKSIYLLFDFLNRENSLLYYHFIEVWFYLISLLIIKFFIWFQIF